MIKGASDDIVAELEEDGQTFLESLLSLIPPLHPVMSLEMMHQVQNVHAKTNHGGKTNPKATRQVVKRQKVK